MFLWQRVPGFPPPPPCFSRNMKGGGRGDTLHLPSQLQCPGLQEEGRHGGSNVMTKAAEWARHSLLSAPPHRACGHLTQAEQGGWLPLQLKVPGRENLLLGNREHLCKEQPKPTVDALPLFHSLAPDHPLVQITRMLGGRSAPPPWPPAYLGGCSPGSAHGAVSCEPLQWLSVPSLYL